MQKATIALFASCALASSAQTSILYNSNHAKVGDPIPRECLSAGAALMHGLVSFPHPSKWTYIIMCDDFSWSDAMMAAKNERGMLIYGATNPYNHTSLLRGTTLRGEGDQRVTAEQLVSHELAHIFLHSNDESKADKLSNAWILQHHSTREVSASAE